ncbi:MAG TPA: POTRA domain-containing protein, partial [Anaeromyxobacteraceae bacterium]|nr:POTRA domain-containing protein [Anaeromyxobacteraceae bacterium]
GAPVVREGAAGAEVALPVEPGPRVAIAVRGAVAFTPAELRARLGLDDEQAFDLPAIDAAADKLRAFYRARGFAAARVEAEERPAGADLAVVFHVDEGRPYRLGEVRFEGATWRTEEALRARLAELVEEESPAEPPSPAAERARALAASVPGVRPLREPPPPLPPGAALDEVALARALELLVDEYRSEGFLEAGLLGWTTELDAGRGEAAVTVRLREGARTTVESIGFEGNAEVPLAELAKEARLAPGDPLVYEKVEATRVGLLRLYLSRSHLYARVEARESVDPVRHVAALRFVVSEGPRVRIGRVLVAGNVRTREDVVRRALEVREGQLHDPEAMARSQAALLRLGVFRSVGLRLQDPEVPEPVKDMVVEVAERPWQYVAPGAGFSLANGPRLFLEYGRPNLLGRALELTARAKVNYPVPLPGNVVVERSPKNTIEGRADVGLRAPHLDPIPLPVAGRANLIAEKVIRRAYDLGRVSGILGADFAVTSRTSLSLQYELEIDRITKSAVAGVLTQADVERLRFDDGTTTLHALRPSATFDFRDNAAHPRRGWLATGSAEYARSLGGPGGRLLFLPGSEFFTHLVKLQGTLSGYLPVGPATVLALSLRGGRVIRLSDRSRTIIPKRFFLGGASTIRGFAEEEMVPQDLRAGLAEEARHCASSISGAGCTPGGRALADGQLPASEGGEVFLLMKAELRLAVKGNVELGLFVDVGNLWLDPRAYRLLDVRPSAGFGLRFVTPVGPAALDLGFNLQPDARLNERTIAPHFTIGLF